MSNDVEQSWIHPKSIAVAREHSGPARDLPDDLQSAEPEHIAINHAKT
jgi:hypothetical protein